MSKLIGIRGGKCFIVALAGLTSKVGAEDESEAIRLFRLHHNLQNDTQRASVEPAEFDPEEPEVEKLEPVKEPKGKGKGKGKGNVVETSKEETLKSDQAAESDKAETEAPGSDAASTEAEKGPESQSSTEAAE